MKKKILGIAAAIMALVAINASAQTSDTNTANNCTNGQAKCKKAEKCDNQKGKCVNPFDGLNLTDAQKQSLKDIKKPSCKKDSSCTKANKECTKADKKEMKAERAQRMETARKEYLSQIQQILTPEQYQQFLENNFVNGAPRHNKHAMKNGKKGNKHAMKKQEMKKDNNRS